MKLYVVRHGIAEEAARGQADEDRRLTREGREDFARGADGLARLGVRLDRLFTSPLVRARETAVILQQALGGPAPEVAEVLAPGGGAVAALRFLESTGDRVAVVGHEPDLGVLVSTAVFGRASDATPLRKGGVACLRFEGRHRPGGATLSWLLTPKQLRRLG